MTALYLVIAVLLLVLNAFFVLGEFAAVKVRPSRIDALIAQGNRRARRVKDIQTHLDEYLSVCQVGITFTSIGLGFVAEPAVVVLLEPIVAWTGLFPHDGTTHWLSTHGVAFGLAYLVVSYLHIVIGELVPKSAAIRLAERASLLTAAPLQVCRWTFMVPLWVLNSSANAILRLLGLPAASKGEQHSEDELRIILARSHSAGVMSFRRLLFLENVFDLGELKVRDAMRPRGLVKVLRSGAPWAENLQAIREARFSRYPLLDAQDRPLGIVHIKDIVLVSSSDPDLVKAARGFVGATDDAPLEQLLTEMQRRRVHVALVTDRKGEWTGFITMEDIIEEIIGTIEDEFGADTGHSLADSMGPGRVQLELRAGSMDEAIALIFSEVAADELPLERDVLIKALREREALVSTYLGNGIAMPHARMPGLLKPLVIFARSPEGVPIPGRGDEEKAHLFFVLLTPAGQPRIHQRLQARIAGILDSDFIDLRLREAPTATEVLEAVRTGEQTALD